MAPTHVVILAFKPDASTEKITQCCDEFLALKQACLLASTQQPYIESLKGGRDMSIEGLSNGFTHAFIVEFASVADRDYYVKEDAAHRSFVERWIASADAIASKAMVVDFVTGSF